MTTSIEQLRRALARTPQDPELHYELGRLLLQNGQAADAFQSYQYALRLAPGHPQILMQLGNACSAMGKYQEAVRYFQQSLRADASDPATHFNLGNALRELGQPEAAAQAYRAALKLTPNDADTHNNLGNVLREQGKLDEAIACYQEALRLNPNLHHARMHLLHQRQHMCDWHGFEEEISAIRQIVARHPDAQISPFAFLSLPGTTPEEQRRCAENWVRSRYSGMIEDGKRLNYQHTKAHRPKLRIGYLSGDFRLHPLAFLITELLELHDRERFEIYAYSYGMDDHSPQRDRLIQACDVFRDIRPISQHEAAQQIHADKIDILVDLTGFTQTSRTGILALRPAPIQISWLGFPGTMGAPFVDYLISDRFITPPEQAGAYSEQLLLLPDTYQPNDRKRPVGPLPTRASCGLPDDGIVFCCFNQTFKITPQLFDIWMDLLSETTGSVLWLLECNPWAKANLRKEASKRGVSPDRLVFAPRVPIAEHLARQQLADIFLDTLPYNAHTTTSDALWVGLPVLTCAGKTFSSRVAGSLLRASGVPELVTSSLEAYQAKVRELARNPSVLHGIRERLRSQRASNPIFDTPRFAGNLEEIYLKIWRQWVA
jgi:protein O-GlcNAc transferase